MINLIYKLTRCEGVNLVNQEKPVLIRGINQIAYKRFVAKAKEQGKTVGDLMNETIGKIIEAGSQGENPGPNPNTIEIAGSVLLSKEDIFGIRKEMGPFSLRNSGRLTLEQDVDREAIQYINKIQNTGLLRVPKQIHPLILIKAGKVYGTIEKY
jgi:hypothetical protein